MIASASAGKKKIEERKLNEENNSSNTKNLSQMELKMELLKFMIPGESVTKAMNRYSSKNKVLIYLLTHLLAHLLTYLLTYSLTYSLTHLRTHLLTHSLTHLLTH